MYKKVLGILIIATMMCLLASCSCAGGSTVETAPPKTYEITPNIEIGEYADFVTYDVWINEKTGDTITFNDNGTFEGKIDGDDYSGVFTLRVDKNTKGRVIVGITLEGSNKEVDYTMDFKESSAMTLTTDKGVSESYVAEWTTKN